MFVVNRSSILWVNRDPVSVLVAKEGVPSRKS